MAVNYREHGSPYDTAARAGFGDLSPAGGEWGVTTSLRRRLRARVLDPPTVGPTGGRETDDRGDGTTDLEMITMAVTRRCSDAP
ncbi:MAG: hypothetical protein LC808_19335 [Actinobacteria bacterium]|nr:hypothetical protein [Actinomycetota bacterium]